MRGGEDIIPGASSCRLEKQFSRLGQASTDNDCLHIEGIYDIGDSDSEPIADFRKRSDSYLIALACRCVNTFPW